MVDDNTSITIKKTEYNTLIYMNKYLDKENIRLKNEVRFLEGQLAEKPTRRIKKSTDMDSASQG